MGFHNDQIQTEFLYKKLAAKNLPETICIDRAIPRVISKSCYHFGKSSL